MKDLLRNTFAPLTSLLIIMLGTSFFNTFMSIRISTDGWNSAMTGLVYSAYYLGMMIGAIYMEKVINRTGHIRAFAIFAACTACAITLQSFTLSPISWLLFRVIMGMACAGLFIVIESWLLLLSSSSSRGAVLSLYMVSLYSAQSVGQFILNFVPIQTNMAFSLTVVFCTLSIIPVCVMKASAPPTHESEYINIFYLLKKVPLGFIGNFIAGLILGSFYALGPVFAKESNFDIWQISLIMSVTIFGGMALQWPIGLFSDLVERRKVIITIALVLLFISIILFTFEHIPFPALLFLLFFYGGFSFTLYPISITYCCDFFSSAGLTSVTCAALVIYGIGCILGPLLSPLVMEVTKPSGLFLFTAILSLILAIYASWRQHKLPQQAKDTKEPYQALPGTSPRAADLDPRAEDKANSHTN